MQCWTTVQATVPVEDNKHPNFEWRGGGGMRIVLFSKATLGEDMSQQSTIVVWISVSLTLALIIHELGLGDKGG